MGGTGNNSDSIKSFCHGGHMLRSDTIFRKISKEVAQICKGELFSFEEHFVNLG